MSLWYIDALDHRGGLCFASRREPDLFFADRLADAPTAFVAAPHFVPEFVGNRATAFAFARGRAQIGLFRDGKEEVGFDSVEAVAEFVRRAYLRGSGGNGPGEDGVPPLPGGGPDEGPAGAPDAPEREERAGDVPPHPMREEPFGGTGRDPVRGLVDLGAVLATLSHGAEEPRSVPTAEILRPVGMAAPADPRLVADRLVRAAARLLAELGRRGWMVKGGAEAFRWQQSGERLFAILARVGLLPILARHPALAGLERSWPAWARPRLEGAEGRWLRIAGPGVSLDPYEDLCHVPVPERMVESGGRVRGSPSLRALLMSVLATPAERLAEAEGEDRELAESRAELALLAACHLNVGTSVAPHDWSIDLTLEFIAALAARAGRWMEANLPRRVFAPPVEALIAIADRTPA